MSITNTNAVAKFAAVVAGLGLVAMSFASFAVPAKADEASDLAAEIAKLTQAYNALTGGASASVTFTRDLTIGSTGQDVTALQNWLIKGGFAIPAGATGYFGAQTQAALAKYQASVMISPAAGYFGPITRAKVNGTAGSGGSTGGTGSTGGLSGGAGDIGDADFVSSFSGEEVGEGDEDVEVAGLEIEADGSDIEITAVTIVFDESTGATDDFEDYATEVSVWFDGEEVARVDADEFQDDDDYENTISLDNGVVIDEDEKGEIVIAISAQDNLDNDQIGDEWDVAFSGVRFKDAQGATVTDTSTGDIDSTVPAGTTSESFSFESFATAGDVELHISAGDDEINDSRTITIDDNDNTDDVEILSFMMEAEGDSDLEIKDLGVNMDVTGESHVDDVVAGGTNPAIRLMIDGEEYGDAEYFDDADDTDVGTDEDILFEGVDYVLDAGSEVEVIVMVDLLSTGDGLEEGSTISANVGETETDQVGTFWDVEDESGEDLTDSEYTGAASGEAHSLFESGIEVVAVSTSAEKNDDDTIGTFEVEVDITAFGEDQYIYKGADTASSSSSGFIYTIYEGGTATSTFYGTASDLLQSSADEVGGDYFRIDEGETERFTLTVTLDPTATTRLYNIEVDTVRFDPDNADDNAATDDTHYTIPDSEDTETNAVSLDAS